MALDLSVRYQGRINPSSAEYPYGSIKNESSIGSNDGTLVDQDWCNDIYGLLQSLLSAAGISPTNVADEVGSSQYLDAINYLISVGQSPKPKYTIVDNSNSAIALGSSNNFEYIDLTSPSPVTITMVTPVAPFGDTVTIEKAFGSGEVTIEAAAGVNISIIDGGSNVLSVDGQVASLVSKNATTWKLIT